jgi:phage baseplate assembly protein W
MATPIDEFYKIDLLHDGDFVAAPNGDFALAKGIVNLKQALFHRLITVQGTLVHRPLYGVGVKLWQNDIGSIPRQRELATAIKQQFEQDERVDEVVGVKVEKIKENGTFEVTYRVEVSGGKLLEETVDPFGEITL